jgi:hypothetical protein
MMEYRSEEQRCYTHGIDHILRYYLPILIRCIWFISTSMKPWNDRIYRKCSLGISQVLSFLCIYKHLFRRQMKISVHHNKACFDDHMFIHLLLLITHSTRPSPPTPVLAI